MAVQSNNLLLLDSLGFERTIDTANDTLEIGVDTSIGGNLTVSGDIISRSQVDVILQDAFLDLGFASTDPGTTAASGGFTVMMNRNANFTAGTITAFTAGGASGPTFTYTNAGGSTLLADGDIVAISGATNGGNDGYFIVDSVDQAAFPQVVTIHGTGGTAVPGYVPFAQNQFDADTGNTADGYKVDVAAVALADGTTAFKKSDGTAWDKGTFVTAYVSNATEGDFNANAAWDALSNVTLDEAYDAGNEITTSGGRAVIISGSELLQVTSSAGVQINTGPLDVNSSVDVDLTGSFAVDGNQAVAFGGAAAVASFAVDTVGAFSVLADQASSVRVDGANLTLQTATSGAIVANSVADFDVTAVNLDADLSGALQIDAGAGSNITVDSADLAISTTNSGDLQLASAALMDVNAGANLDIDVTGTYNMAATSTFTVAGTGNSSITATSGNLSLATATSGNFDVTSAGGVAITAADGSALSVDHEGGSSFTIGQAGAVGITSEAGAAMNLTTQGSGAFDITSDGSVSITAADGSALSLDHSGGSSFQISAAGQVDIAGESGAAMNLGTTQGNLQLTTTTSGNIKLDATGSLTLESEDDSKLEMVANAAGSGKTLLIQANNTNNAAGSDADLVLKAKTKIQIGDSGAYAGTLLEFQHLAEFQRSGGYPAVAGEALATGDAVRVGYDQGNSETRFFKASNNDGADVNRVVYGIVAAPANAGDAVAIQSVAGTLCSSALNGLADTDVGKSVFLGTAGALTLTAPTASGTSVFKVGYIVGHDSGAGSTATIHLAPEFVAKRP